MTLHTESISPLGSRLLLRPVVAPGRVGLIHLAPETQAAYVSLQGEVIARGADVEDWRLQPGARVIYRQARAYPLDPELVTVWEEDCVGIVD
jgi:hypothetical protein